MTGRDGILFAFDVGRKKTGVAIGNQITGGARPLTTVSGGSHRRQLEQLAPHIDEWQPCRCIVGLPRHMDGTEHRMTAVSRRFAHALSARFLLPVEFVDERLTTFAASRLSSTDRDAAAAAVILQDWFDQKA